MITQCYMANSVFEVFGIQYLVAISCLFKVKRRRKAAKVNVIMADPFCIYQMCILKGASPFSNNKWDVMVFGRFRFQGVNVTS